MWSMFRGRKRKRRSRPGAVTQTPMLGAKLLVKVVDIVASDQAQVIIGPGLDYLDGGTKQQWPLDWVPRNARLPNGEFYVGEWTDGVPKVYEKSG